MKIHSRSISQAKAAIQVSKVLLLGSSSFLASTVFAQFPHPVDPFNEGPGSLKVQHSLKCLDGQGIGPSNGRGISQQHCNRRDGQQFELRPVPGNGGYFLIVNRQNGQCLDLAGASTEPGTKIVQWSCHGGDNQQFRMHYTAMDRFSIVIKHSQQCLDLEGGFRDNGTSLIQWPCGGGKNQEFAFAAAKNEPRTEIRSVMTVDSSLRTGEFIRSPGGKAFAMVHNNGNFCTHKGSGPEDDQGAVWCSNFNLGRGDYYATMQPDGNFCVYRGTNVADKQNNIWCHGIRETGHTYFARVSDKGEFQVNAVGLSRSGLQPETSFNAETARKYAPLIYMQQDEAFFPSSVEFFLDQVSQDGDFLVTKESLDCPTCTNLSFLNGQRPDKNSVPIYAEIVERSSLSSNVVDIVYWAFFPYNRGKRVCLGHFEDTIGIGCIGGYSTFGHHVGDWEHVTVRFVDGYPQDVAMEAHGTPRAFPWGSSKVKMVSEFHPIIYSAQGSHGFYEFAGRNTYKHIKLGEMPVDTLNDDMGQGIPWYTWNNVVAFFYQTPGTFQQPMDWLNYTGRWGNRKDGCGPFKAYQAISGECMLNDGPSSILGRSEAQPTYTGLQ